MPRSEWVKLELKVSSYVTCHLDTEVGGAVLFILNPGARGSIWSVPRPGCFALKKETHCTRGWLGRRVGLEGRGGKTVSYPPTVVRTPVPPARDESLY